MTKSKELLLSTCLAAALVCAGCKDDDKPQNTGGGTTANSPASGGEPAPATQGTAGTDEHNRLPIGEATVGGLKLAATQDEPVKPGGEGAFDVTITGGKLKAVRFWVGTESGEESVKARAEEETPDTWHTHVEVPDPLPAGSKFWVEVEPATGQPFKASFDLKPPSKS